MPKEQPRRNYADSFAEEEQLDAEEWIAFHLFEKSQFAYEMYPETATERLAQQILIEMGLRFIEPGTSRHAPHMVALKQRIVDLLKALDTEAIEHRPGEEACNEAGREIVYLVIEATRPDLLEQPQPPTWLINGGALGLGMLIMAVALFVVHMIWPGWRI